MYLSSLFFLAGAFTTSVLAKVTDDYGKLDYYEGTATFCNEKNYEGECSEPVFFEWGECYLIPDSNAKGDKGSSFATTGGVSYCTLHTDVNCTGEASAEVIFMREIKREPPYRSFKCRRITKIGVH